jgi:hypothetical protein
VGKKKPRAMQGQSTWWRRYAGADLSLPGAGVGVHAHWVPRPSCDRSLFVISEHTDEDGATIFQEACRMGLEGIVSKKLSAPYRSGPSRDWLKVKNPDSPAMIRARETEW